MKYATYQTTSSKNGKGTYYFTDCGHRLFSVGDPDAYHGRLCPACLNLKDVETTLFIRGSKEANHIMAERNIATIAINDWTECEDFGKENKDD